MENAMISEQGQARRKRNCHSIYQRDDDAGTLMDDRSEHGAHTDAAMPAPGGLQEQTMTSKVQLVSGGSKGGVAGTATVLASSKYHNKNLAQGLVQVIDITITSKKHARQIVVQADDRNAEPPIVAGLTTLADVPPGYVAVIHDANTQAVQQDTASTAKGDVQLAAGAERAPLRDIQRAPAGAAPAPSGVPAAGAAPTPRSTLTGEHGAGNTTAGDDAGTVAAAAAGQQAGARGAGADAAAVPRRASSGKFGGSTNKHPCPTPGCTGRVYPNQKQCTVCKYDVKALRAQKAKMQHAGKPSIKSRNAMKKIKAKLLACTSRCHGLHVAVVFKRPNVKKIAFQGYGPLGERLAGNGHFQAAVDVLLRRWQQEEKHGGSKHAKTIAELLEALELPAGYEQQLEAEAITSIADLRDSDKEDLIKCGIKRGHANKIRKALGSPGEPTAQAKGKGSTMATGPAKGRAKAKAAEEEEHGNSGGSSSEEEEDSSSEGESSSGEGSSSSDDMEEGE